MRFRRTGASCRPWSIAALFGQNHSFSAYGFRYIGPLCFILVGYNR